MDFTTLRALPRADQIRLKNSAKIAQRLEDEWATKIGRALQDFTPQVVAHLERTGKAIAPNLEELFIEHFFDVSIRAIRHAEGESEYHTNLPRKAGRTLARVPKINIPESLQQLMKLQDLWRKKKYKPKRAVVEAKNIQKQYLKKVSSVWEEHSHVFRSGEVASQEYVVKQIQEEADTTASRAKTIVRTETTSYYNKARKSFYDESEDITHYLFIAIRDAGTSPWCTPMTINGKRGRSGLVYAKSDPLCSKECPACHPGCRSEMLPLHNLNPAHLRFIQDFKIQRRNVICFPLLRGWKAA